MRVLSIGNSYSQNTSKYIEYLSKEFSYPVEVINLYIASCSIKMHVENIKDNTLYEYQINGECTKKVNLKEVLNQEPFDIITIQQFSGDSGDLDSLEPYLLELIKYIGKTQKQAEIVYHKTWSYEQISDHPYFDKYQNDSNIMDQSIDSVTNYIVSTYKLDYIPMGNAVRLFRAHPLYKDEVLSLDHHHLNTPLGKIFGALMWYAYFTQRPYSEKEMNTKLLDLDSKVTGAMMSIINHVMKMKKEGNYE